MIIGLIACVLAVIFIIGAVVFSIKSHFQNLLMMVMAVVVGIHLAICFYDTHSQKSYTDFLIDYTAVQSVSEDDENYDMVTATAEALNREITESKHYRDIFFLNWFVNHDIGDLPLIEGAVNE